MAAYAVISAAEVCTRGRTGVEIVIFSSDNCLLASMSFDIKETGTETAYQIGAGVFQALAREKDCRGPHGPSFHSQLSSCLPLLRAKLKRKVSYSLQRQPIVVTIHNPFLEAQCKLSGELDSTTLSDPGSSLEVVERGNPAEMEA